MLRFTTSFFFAASIAMSAGACLDQSSDLAADTGALENGDGCACAAAYDPVCGANGVTYSNACRAACEQVGVAAAGECATDEATRVCPAHYDPVCGAGGRTYSNACVAAREQGVVVHSGECGIEGDMCGGFAGFACAESFKCRYDEGLFGTAPHADAAGTCVPANYCDVSADCGGFPNAHVAGAWTCDEGFNVCGWQTASGWLSVPGWRFSSGRPYANRTDEWKTLTLPEDATAARLVNLGAFALENGYDTLEIQSKRGRRWVTVRTVTGTVASSASVVLTGREHRIHFTSDASVTGAGFDLVAEFTRH